VSLVPEKASIEVTLDDAARLSEIAGERENVPQDLRRHFDQDDRDTRYLRLMEKRIRAALQDEPDPAPASGYGDRL
jgi:hypothetical protein